jgi:hypothetical protein
MEFIQDQKNNNPCCGLRSGEGQVVQVPMHPDDFEAHLAWVTAKRFHEQAMGKTFSEKPVYFRILG